MKFVIQRVNSASVKVDGNVIGSIGKGYLILFGAGEGDTEDMLVPFADKICKMRIFADENGKTNLSINDVGGEMLIVSQFTLYADCRKGNRPSFVHACEPDLANELYEKFVALCRERVAKVETGEFGADNVKSNSRLLTNDVILSSSSTVIQVPSIQLSNLSTSTSDGYGVSTSFLITASSYTRSDSSNNVSSCNRYSFARYKE